MYRFIYLNSDSHYGLLLATRKDAIAAFKEIESKGFIIITIYDHTKRIQLYRCLNYEYHRNQLLTALKGFK